MNDEPPAIAASLIAAAGNAADHSAVHADLTITALQDVIERTYGERDRSRGTATSVAWLCEEVGELAQAIRKGTPDQQRHEFADVIAWVVSLANQLGVDLAEAVGGRYAEGCPRCLKVPCSCPM